MSDEVNPFALLELEPLRQEPRGKFPRHSDRPHRVLGGAEAAEWAREQLDEWKREHGAD